MSEILGQPPRSSGLEERLERGEIIHYPVCPFPLPQGDDHRFLLEQRLGGRMHKNISYDPHTGTASGFLQRSGAQAERLTGLLASFARTVTAWAADTLPLYARGWRLDKVSFRPEEEAIRKLRHKARNDLLHVDAFPSRPTHGWRILRVFVNINPTQPRVWLTSEPFGQLLERYGAQVGLPGAVRPALKEVVKEWVQEAARLFRPGRPPRSPYDAFMLRFHDFLKANEDFQEHAPKRFWNFGPFSAWMVITDTASHAVLRGRFALEHSYFVSPQALALPDESPAALLARACGRSVLNAAA
jgi:3-deoxy-D-manno-oct-2-ulosonic acid (Kdo) hydroxylase